MVVAREEDEAAALEDLLRQWLHHKRWRRMHRKLARQWQQWRKDDRFRRLKYMHEIQKGKEGNTCGQAIWPQQHYSSTGSPDKNNDTLRSLLRLNVDGLALSDFAPQGHFPGGTVSRARARGPRDERLGRLINDGLELHAFSSTLHVTRPLR